MRKLNILKAIVDFIWIVSMPIIPIVILLVPALFFYDNLSDLNLRINGIELITNDIISKILMSISVILYLLIIYCIHLFKKVLLFFTRTKIFDQVVIKSFSKIGNILTLTGIMYVIISFIGKAYFEQKLTIELSLNPNLILICMGLFFLILSEIFKIAKNAKQENDLTI
jgi:hypothetical protein